MTRPRPKPKKCDADPATPTDAASQKDAKTGRFLPGNSGFGGRPRGARNKLSEAFIQDFYEFWRVNGPDVFKITMVKRPGDLLRAAAQLLPKQAEVTSSMDEMSDEQLAIIAEQLLAKYGGRAPGSSSLEESGEDEEGTRRALPPPEI